MIRQYGRQYYRYGMEARKQIAEYPLSLLFEREWRGRFVVHQDLASHNWLLDRRGKSG